MTHDELLAKIDDIEHKTNHTPLPLGVQTALLTQNKALRAVVELHKPKEQVTGMNSTGQVLSTQTICSQCSEGLGAYATVYPCPTIQAIEKELNNDTR